MKATKNLFSKPEWLSPTKASRSIACGLMIGSYLISFTIGPRLSANSWNGKERRRKCSTARIKKKHLFSSTRSNAFNEHSINASGPRQTIINETDSSCKNGSYCIQDLLDAWSHSLANKQQSVSAAIIERIGFHRVPWMYLIITCVHRVRHYVHHQQWYYSAAYQQRYVEQSKVASGTDGKSDAEPEGRGAGEAARCGESETSGDHNGLEVVRGKFL